MNKPLLYDASGRVMNRSNHYGLLTDEQAIPHVLTFSSILTSGWRAYWHEQHDEALKNSREDAMAMWADASIQSLIDERILNCISKPWRVEVPDEKDPLQKEVQSRLTTMVERIPFFQKFLRNEALALWYGRYANNVKWKWENIEGHKCLCVKKWSPINGDKIGYQTDGTPYVMVNPAYTEQYGKYAEIIPTTYGGFGLVLRNPWWREQFVIHKHNLDDADYFEPEMAGAVGGVGLRSYIYWWWFLRQEWLERLSNFIDQAALGVKIWYYPMSNPTAREDVISAAKDLSANRTNIFVPVSEESYAKGLPPIERVDVPMGGAEFLRKMIEYTDEVMERRIVGQTMSGGDDGKGSLGGTGRADFARDTKFQILKYDCNNLAETITGSEEEPGLISMMQKYSFPNTWDKFKARFVFSLESPESKEKLDAISVLIGAGLPIKQDDAYNSAGLTKPGEGDETIGGQQPGMPGQDPMAGMPPMGGDAPEDGDNIPEDAQGNPPPGMEGMDDGGMAQQLPIVPDEEPEEEYERSNEPDLDEEDLKELVELGLIDPREAESYQRSQYVVHYDDVAVKEPKPETDSSTSDTTTKQTTIAKPQSPKPITPPKAPQSLQPQQQQPTNTPQQVPTTPTMPTPQKSVSEPSAPTQTPEFKPLKIEHPDDIEANKEQIQWVKAQTKSGKPVWINNATNERIYSTNKPVKDPVKEASRWLEKRTADPKVIKGVDQWDFFNRAGEVLAGNPNIKPDILAKAAGGSQGAEFSVRTHGLGMISIDLEDGHHEVKEQSRTLEIGDDGSLTMSNDYKTRKRNARGKGGGAAELANQVQAMIELGGDQITTLGARGSGMVGYLVWPILGFNAEIDEDTKSKLVRSKKLPENIRQAKTIRELVSTPEGRQWWKKHGDSTDYAFDISEGSEDIKALNAYLDKKGLSQHKIKVPEGYDEKKEQLKQVRARQKLERKSEVAEKITSDYYKHADFVFDNYNLDVPKDFAKKLLHQEALLLRGGRTNIVWHDRQLDELSQAAHNIQGMLWHSKDKIIAAHQNGWDISELLKEASVIKKIADKKSYVSMPYSESIDKAFDEMAFKNEPRKMFVNIADSLFSQKLDGLNEVYPDLDKQRVARTAFNIVMADVEKGQIQSLDVAKREFSEYVDFVANHMSRGQEFTLDKPIDDARIDAMSVDADEDEDKGNSIGYDLAATAGVDSDFTPEQLEEAKRLWDEQGIESPYFKKWSGSAPVVTLEEAKNTNFETGKPVVIEALHGMKGNLVGNEFDFDHPDRFDAGWLGTGVYATTSQSLADNYALFKRGKGEENVLQLYIKLDNPYITTREEKEKIAKIEEEYGREVAKAAADAFTQKLRDQGYDGVILQYPETKKRPSHKEIVAFDKTAVKLREGNRGTFDPNDPRIDQMAGGKERKIVSKDNIEAFNESLNTRNKRMGLRLLLDSLGIEKDDSSFERGGLHSPASPEDGSPGYDLADNGVYPEDVYSSQGLKYYGTGYEKMDEEAYRLIKWMEGKPNAQVTVYRAVEKDYKGGINPGDWVTTVRDYAEEHGEGNIPDGYKIIKQKVTAKDIYTSGDSFLEWGYHPQKLRNYPKPFVKDAEGKYMDLQERVDRWIESRGPNINPMAGGYSQLNIPENYTPNPTFSPNFEQRLSEIEPINTVNYEKSREQFTNNIAQAIENNTALSEQQKSQYKKDSEQIFAHFTPAMWKHIEQNSPKVGYYGTHKEVSQAAYADMIGHERFQYLPVKLQKEYVKTFLSLQDNDDHDVAGAYASIGRDASLYLDGGDQSKNKSSAEIHAHEIGHAIDGIGKKFSQSLEWKEIFLNEINTLGEDGDWKLSRYASLDRHDDIKTASSEAFAEMMRLVLSGKRGLDEVESALPMASKFLKAHGLWPGGDNAGDNDGGSGGEGPVDFGSPEFDASIAGVGDNYSPEQIEEARRLWKEMGEESPYFKKWFGDSKVVDEDGKPLVVYHGTGADFNVFSNELIGSSTDDGWLGSGFYFTSDPSVASTYADRNKGNIIPAFLSAKNIFDMNGKNFAKVLKEHGGAKKFTEWLVDNGYDGATLWSQYMVINPEQIKSATGNRGTFDAENPRIDKMFAGEGAKTADKSGAKLAQELIGDRKYADLTDEERQQIREQTGYFPGQDGKLRFEIDDSKAEVTEDGFNSLRSLKPQRLGDVLNHPELYHAYPDLAKMRIRMSNDPKVVGGRGGAFYPGGMLSSDQIILGNRLDGEDLMGVLLHEVQHAIQKREGFVGGGNVGMFRSENHPDPIGAYQHLAGENEANATKADRNLTAEQRLQRQPYDSAPKQVGDWIIRDGKGTSFSVEPAEQKTAKYNPLEMTSDDFENFLADASDIVDGMKVRKEVPNIESIDASIPEPTILSGIKEVPMEFFDYEPTFYSESEKLRTKKLAKAIKKNNEINPLIVVFDSTEDPYILEGAHRLDALKMLGKKSFPAKVVIDESAIYNHVEKALMQGKQVPKRVLAEYPDLAAKYPQQADPHVEVESATEDLGLTRRERQIRSPEFKRWFGDYENDPENASKVVDEQGKPLVVYHGTTEDFNEFQQNEKAKTSDSKKAFFFTDSSEVAEGYTWKKGDKVGSIMPVYLDMKNPLIIQGKEFYDSNFNNNAIQKAKEGGYDGVIIKNQGSPDGFSDHYLVLSPNQIKSVTANSGDFSTEDARIDAMAVSDKKIRRLPQVPLGESIRRSGLSEDYYSNSAGVYNSVAWLQNETDAIEGGYALGITDAQNSDYAPSYFALSEAANLKPWTELYREVFGNVNHDERDPVETTREFMDAVAKSGKPIVMFVPNDALNQQSAWTRAELEYLREHPELRERTHFVFGGYDMLKEATVKDLGNKPEYITDFLRSQKRDLPRIFQQREPGEEIRWEELERFRNRGLDYQVVDTPLFAEPQERARQQLTDEQREVIKGYTGSYYSEWNDFLRTYPNNYEKKGLDAVTRDVNEIRKVLANVEELPNPVTVYRGLSVGNEVHPKILDFYRKVKENGQKVQMHGFQSCSISPIVAGAQFAEADVESVNLPIIFEVEAKKGLYLGNLKSPNDTLSDNKKEMEFLVDHNEVFDVVDVEETDYNLPVGTDRSATQKVAVVRLRQVDKPKKLKQVKKDKSGAVRSVTTG